MAELEILHEIEAMNELNKFSNVSGRKMFHHNGPAMLD
jgi:hypothetical protein